MKEFKLYTKTFTNGVKEVYLPLYPVGHMSASTGYVEEAFPTDPEELRKLEEEKAMKNAHDCLTRARNTVYAVAVCNDWDYMVTFTLKENRTDIHRAFIELRSRLKYLKSLYPKFHYLVVGEYHKKLEADGKPAIHFHGLISGLPSTEFGPLVRTKSGNVRDLKRFRSMGFSEAAKVYDKESATKYITKYITKDLISLGMHKSSYVVSRGLKRPERHRYTIREDHVDHFRQLMLRNRAEAFNAAFGTKFSFDNLFLTDCEMFDHMFFLCDFFDDDD